MERRWACTSRVAQFARWAAKNENHKMITYNVWLPYVGKTVIDSKESHTDVRKGEKKRNVEGNRNLLISTEHFSLRLFLLFLVKMWNFLWASLDVHRFSFFFRSHRRSFLSTQFLNFLDCVSFFFASQWNIFSWKTFFREILDPINRLRLDCVFFSSSSSSLHISKRVRRDLCVSLCIVLRRFIKTKALMSHTIFFWSRFLKQRGSETDIVGRSQITRQFTVAAIM